jgi:hypothetical protein
MTIKFKPTFDQMKAMAVANSGLAKVATKCTAETFAIHQRLILLIHTRGGNHHLRQAGKH